MRYRIIGFSLVLALLITIIVTPESMCREKYFSMNLGPSYRAGDNGSSWEKGLSFGLNWTDNLSYGFQYGMRASYGRWLPVCEEIGADYSDPEITWQSCGAVSYAEFSPYLRYAPSSLERKNVDFYGQVGAGLYAVLANWQVADTYGVNRAEYSEQNQKLYPGVSAGFGLIIGNKQATHIELVPNYSYVFANGEEFSFFGFSVGMTGPEGN